MKHKKILYKLEYQEVLSPEILDKIFLYNKDTKEAERTVLDPDDPIILSLFKTRKAINISNSLIKRGVGGKGVQTNKAGNQYVYFRVQINNKTTRIAEHKIVWCLNYGYWPKEIDHIDGNGLNNCISNLKEVSRSENNKNHRRQKNNTSGLSGVSYRKDLEMWRAYAFVSHPKRKQISLGVFDNLFDACCARKSYEVKNGFSERHGR